jgi:RNA polymerase sigma factor (sigma-70 family)
MSRVVSESDLVGLARSFLSKPKGSANAEECWAWNELYREYARIVRARIGGGHHGWIDGDDFFQLVWIILTHRVKTVRFDPARASLEVWIAKIVRDVVRRYTHRFSKHREQSLTPDLADELVDPDDGPDLEVERLLLREELVELIESLRARLCARDHRIVIMRWVEDRSVSEIAGEVHLTEDCVKAKLYRVSLKFRKQLRRKGLGPSKMNFG